MCIAVLKGSVGLHVVLILTDTLQGSLRGGSYRSTPTLSNRRGVSGAV